MIASDMSRTETRWFALLLGAAALLYFYGLGSTGLWAPDEPRFAAVAEELRRMDHGAQSLVVLRLSDQPYTQKPPLYYWLVAGLSSFEGRVSEWTARLPSAIAGVVCIALTVWFGAAVSRRPAVGLWAGAILLTVFRFSHLARRAQLDVILTAFILVALFALFRLRNESRPRGRDFVLLHAALGLGVLTKGPVALLPIPAFALYLAWQGRLAEIKRFFPARSFLLSLGPALLWVALAVAATPAGYFDAAIVDNVFGRFFSGTAHVRPFYYFFLQFPLEFLPWTLLWPAAARVAFANARRSDDETLRDGTRWLVCFVALCFAFFSLSAGKRGLYLLPTYPAVAILCGVALDAAMRRGREFARPLVWTLGSLGLLSIVLGAWLWSVGGFALEAWPRFRLPAAFGAAVAIAFALCIGSGFALQRRSSGMANQLLPTLGGLFALQSLVFALVWPAFDDEKSPAPIARAAAAMSQKGAPIGVFDHTAMKGGIAFYAERPVVDLRSEKSVERFLEAGGESVVIKASKLDRFPRAEDFEVRAGFRDGRRRVVVITPTTPNHPRVQPTKNRDGTAVVSRTTR